MIGHKLKLLRESKKLSQNHVADAIGIDNTSLSKYENDKNIPDLYTLHALSKFYCVPLTYFLPTKHTEQIELTSVLEHQVSFDGYILNDYDKSKIFRILHILFEDKKGS
ncbi:helix-turn-helix domain-containing protein [Pelosinus sp. sgz500959]|uniref:helix-turn-helix domain-containing protein n=1 Tax=Pelosinus sp. sgz500959 TaxID=3242472 RepID=UPI00366F4D67